MSFVNYFYNQTTRRYIALFGTLFNRISIARYDHDKGTVVQRMLVPISYGPYQKFLVRLTQDPGLDAVPAMTLPRMAFEIVGFQYDGSRKITSMQKLKSSVADNQFQYSPAPYNIEFTLSIMTAYAEDATQIFEQIAPFFKPEWTTTMSLVDGIDPFDIPLVLNNVSTEDIYDGDFESRRSILWTLNFTMKAWYLGPVRKKGIIKFVDTRMYDNTTEDDKFLSQVQVYPGLTPDDMPSTDPANTVPWDTIDIGDDWGVIKVFRDEIDE